MIARATKILPALCLCFVVACSFANTSAQSERSSEEYQIGVMVKAVAAAIAAPAEPPSLTTITRYGTDSRYYLMIRGWLVQELAGLDSQISAQGDTAAEPALKQRAEFLRRAIRRIDLE